MAMDTARRRLAALGLVLMVGLVGACGDEDRDDFERLADTAGARSVGEALRVSLLAQDTSNIRVWDSPTPSPGKSKSA